MTKTEIKEYVQKALASQQNKFVIDGTDFTLHRYSAKNGFDAYMWTNNGGDSIGHGNFQTEEEAEEFFTTRIEEYLDGYIHCSDCGVKFPKEEVANYRRSYFAGKYCQHCWDSKWRALEAAETYD